MKRNKYIQRVVSELLEKKSKCSGGDFDFADSVLAEIEVLQSPLKEEVFVQMVLSRSYEMAPQTVESRRHAA